MASVASHARSFSLSVAILAVLTLGTIVPARAQVVFNNGSFNPAGNVQSITSFAVADDIVVALPLTFNRIRFWATDIAPGLLSHFSGTLSWFIHTDTIGLPVSPLGVPSTTIIASGLTSQVSITNTGSTINGFTNLEIAQLEFQIPQITLPPGRYWLRIKENSARTPDDGTPIFWVKSFFLKDLGAKIADNELTPGIWNSSDSEAAFQLLQVPLP